MFYKVFVLLWDSMIRYILRHPYYYNDLAKGPGLGLEQYRCPILKRSFWHILAV